MLQRRIELCGDAPRAPMQPCKRRVRPPTGSPPAQGRFPPEQVQSEKSQGVRGTESPDSFDNTPKKPRIMCPFFRGKYTSRWQWQLYASQDLAGQGRVGASAKALRPPKKRIHSGRQAAFTMSMTRKAVTSP